MAKNKKAQLTLFFIIGIMLIAAFAFVQYLNARTAEDQIRGPTEKLINDLLKTGAIPYYLGVCLEEITEKGITLAGAQGGDIFIDQGGPAPSPTRYVPLGSRVTYGISAPILVNGTEYPMPPGYPGGGKGNSQSPILNFGIWGRFGEPSLRRMCDSLGANSPYAFEQFGYPRGVIVAPICMNNIYTDILSTQWQLERYVEKLIVNCTNWTAIREETGYNVTPVGSPNVTIRLGDSDVWVDAFVPIELVVGGVAPVYAIGDFHSRIPVRLKRVAELASFLATYDSYSLMFNLSRQFKAIYLWDSNMNISVSTPFSSAGIWEDVVTIQDAGSNLNGKDFVYQFARENRYPALDYIHQMTNWSEFDMVMMENDTIILSPNPPTDLMNNQLIYDPDEDKLIYYYTGWKQTCDEKFNFDLGIPRVNCSIKEPSLPENYFDFPFSTDLSSSVPGYPIGIAWKSLPLFSESSVEDDEAYPPLAPWMWTSSDEYLATGRNASVSTGYDDIGPHNVTVWVCDEAGLCDFQVVRIM
ncbi:hypothetical protein HQ545_07115, partial [Candidatus Woesearchaeota archaeon]|nr:hypothetical protein [Candidatus Woesearchaeota archaeon]